MLTFGTISGLERMCLPVLFKEISVDLDLSLVSIGTIWSMDPLAGIFVCLLAGLLADRFGIKSTLTIICILAGIFCALRGLSGNFAGMAVTMFLFGITGAMAPTIAFKTAVIWFDNKRLGLANALLNIAGYTGSMTATMLSATVLSPLMGGWRYVLFLFGIPAVVAGILWWTTGKEKDKTNSQLVPANAVPFRQALSRVIHMREVWILGIIQAAYMGGNMGLSGYLPMYLRDIGWTPARADITVTLISGVTMLGMIPMIIIANRFKAYKGMLLLSTFTCALSFALIPFFQGNTLIAILLISAIIRSSTLALAATLIFQVKGVGSLLGGTATGLTQALTMIAAVIAPPVGNALTSISLGTPFIFWGILVALPLPLFWLLRESASLKKAIPENPANG